MRNIQRDIVGAFIFSKDSKLLLGRSHKGGVYPGYHIVPGGGVEPGESKLEAVKRETLEETGIDITHADIELIDGAHDGESQKTLRETGERVVVKMDFFNYKITLLLEASEVALKAEDDFIDASWFPIKELDQLKLSPPTATTLQKMGILPNN